MPDSPPLIPFNTELNERQSSKRVDDAITKAAQQAYAPGSAKKLASEDEAKTKNGVAKPKTVNPEAAVSGVSAQTQKNPVAEAADKPAQRVKGAAEVSRNEGFREETAATWQASDQQKVVSTSIGPKQDAPQAESAPQAKPVLPQQEQAANRSANVPWNSQHQERR